MESGCELDFGAIIGDISGMGVVFWLSGERILKFMEGTSFDMPGIEMLTWCLS